MVARYSRYINPLLAGAVAMMCLSPALGAGQTRKATAYKTPRTAWGDPDFQGNYTNLYEAGTPLERPAEYDGRKLSDITPAELRATKKAIQDNTIQRFETPFDAPSNWWQVAFRLEDGAQAWLITDPDDGKVPPLTPEGRQRVASARQTIYNGGSDSYEDRSLYDRCITRGFPTSGMPTIYGNSSRIVQGPGYVAIQYEMIHETRIIPIDREPRPHPASRSSSTWAIARTLEGDTLVVETTNFRTRACSATPIPLRCASPNASPARRPTSCAGRSPSRIPIHGPGPGPSRCP
jgi:hypothetical protein